MRTAVVSCCVGPYSDTARTRGVCSARAERIGVDEAAAALAGIDECCADVTDAPEAVARQLVTHLAEAPARGRGYGTVELQGSGRALHEWPAVETSAELAEGILLWQDFALSTSIAAGRGTAGQAEAIEVSSIAPHGPTAPGRRCGSVQSLGRGRADGRDRRRQAGATVVKSVAARLGRRRADRASVSPVGDISRICLTGPTQRCETGAAGSMDGPDRGCLPRRMRYLAGDGQ
jgi:hypothetical protein